MSNCRCEVWLKRRIHVKSTRPFRLIVAVLFEFLTSAQLIQPTQIPLVGIVTHGPFTVAHVHSSEPTQLADSVSRQRFGTHVSRFHCSVHLFMLQSTRASGNWSPLRPTCFDANAVTTALRVVNDALTVCRDSDTAAVPKDRVPDVMAANSSLSELDSAALFCFFPQQLRTPPPRVTTPPLVDLREILSGAQSASVLHKSSPGRGS